MTLTIKQENFAQAYVETSNASEAYRRAYNAEKMGENSIGVEACRLLDSPKVALRVEELKSQHAKRHAITIDDIHRMLEEDRALAQETGKASAAVSATTALAKLYGLMSEKREVDLKGSIDVMTKEQRDAAIAAALRADK